MEYGKTNKMTLTCGIISVIRGIQRKENAMPEMTIQEMVAQWLKNNGYAGLCQMYEGVKSCDCKGDKLLWCIDEWITCQPAKLHINKNLFGEPTYLYPDKPEE